MLKFLWQFLSFIGLLFILCCCIFCFNSFHIRYKQVNLAATTWIVGDSQVMVGISPDLLPDAVNIAQQAEPLVVTYYKLKSLLAYQQPKQLILGFSPHHISDFNDLKFKSSKTASAMFQRTYSIMSPQGFRPFDTDAKALWWSYFQNWCIIPRIKHESYIGGFERRGNYLALSDPQEAIERHFFRAGQVQAGISTQMLSALEAITQLVKAKGVKLILVALPVHQAYSARIPSVFVAAYQVQKEKLAAQAITVLDYSNFPLADSYFSDHDHLNEAGARFFTQLLTQQISF